MIFNMSGGGGDGLNFKVVGGTTQPINPTENTIWVNTDATITSYVLSPTIPTNPTAGMVWITTSGSGSVSFNAVEKNGITLYPSNAKQYINGAWTAVVAKIYQDGVWVAWDTYLFSNGNIFSEFTGGWTETNALRVEPVYGETIYVYADNAYTHIHTVNNLDLSEYKTLTAVFTATNRSAASLLAIGVVATAGSDTYSASWSNGGNTSYDQKTTITVDISGVNSGFVQAGFSNGILTVYELKLST